METGNRSARSAEPAESRFQRGTNQSGMRAHNERLVLSLVRQHGSLAKTDIARMTGLSAQTVSVIMRELEEDGLLLQAGAGARQGRPAVDPDGAQPGRRLFPRPEDRPPQRRTGADRFLGSVRAMLQMLLSLPGAARTRSTSCATASQRCAPACRQSRTSGSPGSASPCRSSCGTGPTRSARRATVMEPWRSLRHPRRDPGRVQLSRSICRTTRPRPAAPNWCSARPAVCAISSISTSAPSPAAASCSTAASTAARPAMPGRSARCRCPGRDGQPTQLIDVASIAILEQALQRAGPRREPICGPRRRTGAISARRSTAGSSARARRSPTASSPPPRSSTSRRRSSTAGCRRRCAPRWSRHAGRNRPRSTSKG